MHVNHLWLDESRIPMKISRLYRLAFPLPPFDCFFSFASLGGLIYIELEVLNVWTSIGLELSFFNIIFRGTIAMDDRRSSDWLPIIMPVHWIVTIQYPRCSHKISDPRFVDIVQIYGGLVNNIEIWFYEKGGFRIMLRCLWPSGSIRNSQRRISRLDCVDLWFDWGFLGALTIGGDRSEPDLYILWSLFLRCLIDSWTEVIVSSISATLIVPILPSRRARPVASIPSSSRYISPHNLATASTCFTIARQANQK